MGSVNQQGIDENFCYCSMKRSPNHSIKNKNKTGKKNLTKITKGLEINQRQINWEVFILDKLLELQVRITQEIQAAIRNMCKELKAIVLKKIKINI